MFGVDSTGAPGSAVPGPESSAGPVVGTVAPVPPYGSSQQSWPSVTVQAGDTSGMSSDQPVNQSELLPDAAGARVTGAGLGHTMTRHPDAGR